MEYQLKYHVKVYDSKYREFLNVLENILDKQEPVGCHDRMAFQSINDIHVFEYKEVWIDINYLKKYIKSNEFMSLQGAFELLTLIKKFSITESIEIDKSTLIDNPK